MDDHSSNSAGVNPEDPAAGGDFGPNPEETLTATELRLRAVATAARFFGIDLDINDYKARPGEPYPSPASLVDWLRGQGLVAKAVKLSWRNLFTFRETTPVVVLLRDGTAGLVVGADARNDVVWIKSPTARDAEPPVAVDRLRLEQAWAGEALLVRRAAGLDDSQAPFTLGWIVSQCFREKRFISQIAWSSIVLSALGIIPAFIVMGTIDRVLEFNSINTWWMLATILGVMMFFEMVLGWARRELILVMSAKLDAKLNLHLFSRLLSLPLDFFERNQAGETISRLRQISRVRDFLTGKLLQTVLDGSTLLVFIPFMFYMESMLATITLRGRGHHDGYPDRIPAADRHPGRAIRACRTQESRGHHRNGARHPHRENAGAGAAAEAGLGRTGGGGHAAGAWPPAASATGRRP